MTMTTMMTQCGNRLWALLLLLVVVARQGALAAKGGSSMMMMYKQMMMMPIKGGKGMGEVSMKGSSSKGKGGSYGSGKGSSMKMMKAMKKMMMMMGKGKGKGGTTSPTMAPTMPSTNTDDLTPMSFQLDWRFNAQFAGVFLADYYGYFAEAGIAMEVRPWENGVNAVMDVANGVADFACAEQNLIITAQADQAPVKAVATMFQGSPYGLMAPVGTDLSSLEALQGQDVGVHIDGLKVMDLVQGVNMIADINVTEIPYANKWDRVAAGEFYAVQCYVIDEPIGVSAIEGVEPEVMRLADFGLLSTAQTIVVADDTLEMQGDLVKGVMSAIFHGWRDALADKETAAEIIVNEYVPPDSSYYDVLYNLRILELLEPYVVGDGTFTIGVIDPNVWAAAAELMLEYDIVSSLPDLDTTLATEYYIPDE